MRGVRNAPSLATHPSMATVALSLHIRDTQWRFRVARVARGRAWRLGALPRLALGGLRRRYFGRGARLRRATAVRSETMAATGYATWTLVPLPALVFAIAVFPAAIPRAWKSSLFQAFVAAACALPIALYDFHTGRAQEVMSTATSYVSFMATLGSQRSFRQAAHASGCDFHHASVFGSGAASGSVVRLRVKVPTSFLSARYAADAKLSIEFGPGIGPSASMSVLT